MGSTTGAAVLTREKVEVELYAARRGARGKADRVGPRPVLTLLTGPGYEHRGPVGSRGCMRLCSSESLPLPRVTRHRYAPFSRSWLERSPITLRRCVRSSTA